MAQTPPPASGDSTADDAQTEDGAARGGRARPSLSTDAAELFRRDRNISVQQRPHEGYEARGLRLGAFLAYPKIAVRGEHSDNIYATPNNEVSDTIFRVMPEISASSNWSRHNLSAYARATVNRYQDFGSEDTEDYGLGLSGRLDVRRDTRINGSIDWARLTEPRTSPNTPQGALEPVQFELGSARITAQHELNRLRLTARYTHEQYVYDNPLRNGGGTLDQSFRDRAVDAFMGRADYAVSPATALFVEVTGNVREYSNRAPVPPFSRDSQGVQLLTGANFELGALARGEVAFGYLRQTFDDPLLARSDGLGARAQVEWFPSQLTTVTFTGARTVEDSAVPGSGTFLSSNVGVQVDHELFRNVIITGQAAFGRDEYDELNRRDDRVTAGIQATYLLNRSVGITAGYNYADQDAVRGGGTPFTVNRVSATITAQF